jgi:deazaflavin-dependent oxidoreductase (nitroreductase family)
MPPKPLVTKLPEGLLRFILRLPIVFYSLRLGWLLGDRFVLLIHIGRKTGRLRRTVVEVIGYEEETDTYYIVSGWGYQANWYQNLLATPQISIEVGRRRLEVHAKTLPTEESAQILLSYRQRHPIAARELSRLMGLDLSEASPLELEGIIKGRLPVLGLQHTSAVFAAARQMRSKH